MRQVQGFICSTTQKHMWLNHSYKSVSAAPPHSFLATTSFHCSSHFLSSPSVVFLPLLTSQPQLTCEFQAHLSSSTHPVTQPAHKWHADRIASLHVSDCLHHTQNYSIRPQDRNGGLWQYKFMYTRWLQINHLHWHLGFQLLKK